MVRVLHYIGSLQFGGSQSFVVELYRKIDRRELQFDFVVYPGETGGLYHEIISLGGRVYECPRYSGGNHFAFCNWWNTFLTEHTEYHIVHAHVRSSASICLSIAKKHGCLTIIHSHSTSNGKGISAVVKCILQLPLRYISDYLFSCSDEAGKWLYGEKATHQSNYSIIPNCIDCKRFAYSEPVRKAIRDELGIEEDCFVVGHIGRFREAKNHKYLVRIFNEILNKNPNSKLMLVGDGELRGGIEEMCRQFGIKESVIFTGARQNTEQYYQAMDIFVFPSIWEGLPLSVVEAQASGLHCIISDKITRNVQLTELVEFYSLERTPEDWATRAMQYTVKIREMCDEEQHRSIMTFDNYNVAKKLQQFYLQCSVGDKDEKVYYSP
jgi:glycosyltransferase involved in cell wall biosynthesis